MEHIGIDLGARHSHVVVISSDGASRRWKVPTCELPQWLSRRAPGRVVMEACTQSPAIARASNGAKHETRVVPGQLVRMLGVGARGIKTDERDAEALAQASVRTAELPSVHLCSEKSRAQRQMIGARALLLKARGSIARNIKTWLRSELIVVRGRASTTSFCETVRKIALEKDLGLPLAIETMLDTFEHLTRQVAKLDEQIEAVVEQDAVCKKLMGVGGVGEKVSLAFTSQVDDPKRFRSADALASYLALVPGEATTGGKVKRTGAIKAGPKYLKALLVQAAWSMWRCRPNDPMVIWAQRIADKRGKRIAVIALARKLATVMWAIWRHDGTYDPKRAANIVPSGTS